MILSVLLAVVLGFGTWSQSTLASALLDPGDGDGESMAHCLGWQYRHCRREDLEAFGCSPRNVIWDNISQDFANASSSVGGGAAAPHISKWSTIGSSTSKMSLSLFEKSLNFLTFTRLLEHFAQCDADDAVCSPSSHCYWLSSKY